MSNNTTKQKEIVILNVNETILSSLVKDIISFTLILVFLYLSVISGQTVWCVIGFFIVAFYGIMAVSKRLQKQGNKFTSKEDAIKYLQSK